MASKIGEVLVSTGDVIQAEEILRIGSDTLDMIDKQGNTLSIYMTHVVYVKYYEPKVTP